MESTLLIALSRADVLSRNMNVVANNIANVTTAGYKAQRMMFQVAEEKPVPSQPLDFVMDRSTYLDLSPGVIQQTGNPLDVAIDGEGYFTVKLPDGQQVYSRNGGFQLNAEGTMVDQNGNAVMGDGGTEIQFQPDTKDITIGADGTITSDTQVLGKLSVVEFADRQRMLTAYGDGYYRIQNGAAPETATSVRVIQGSIEGSNVQAVREMTEMMEVTRNYQSVQKILDNEHERIRNAVRTIARTA